VVVDTTHLNNNYNNIYGDSSRKITDIWLSTDGDFRGAFEIPARMPLLMAGKHLVTFHAGVKVDGISATRAIYPFYTEVDTVLDLQRTQKTAFAPVFHYDPNTLVAFYENFDGPKWNLVPVAGNNNCDTFLSPDIDPKFGGSNCLKATLTQSKNTFFFVSSGTNSSGTTSKGIFTNFSINEPVWLEISFKTDVPITIGLFAFDVTNSNGPDTGITCNDLVILAHSTQWNKVYIDLSQLLISSEPPGYYYQLYIDAVVNPGDISDNIYLDNIKILYFE
jgi:hypothetical protein